jgi:methylglyoxal synthase
MIDDYVTQTQIFKSVAITFEKCKEQLVPLVDKWKNDHPNYDILAVSQEAYEAEEGCVISISTEYMLPCGGEECNNCGECKIV